MLEKKSAQYRLLRDNGPCASISVNYFALEVFGLPFCMAGPIRQHCSRSDSVGPASLGAAMRTWLMVKLNAGLWLTLMALGAYLMYLHQERETMRTYLQDPRVEDIYLVNMQALGAPHHPRFPFTLLMLSALDDSKAHFIIGEHWYSKAVSPFTYLTRGANTGGSLLSSDRLSVDRRELPALFENGGVYAVKRPYRGYVDGWISLSFLYQHDPRREDLLSNTNFRF